MNLNFNCCLIWTLILLAGLAHGGSAATGGSAPAAWERPMLVSPQDVELSGTLSAACQRAVERLALSARAIERVRRLARTIADMEASEHVRGPHVAEALQYRFLDREAT